MLSSLVSSVAPPTSTSLPLIYTKLADENIIELRCGDFIHEQCLNVSVECSVNKSLESSTFTVSRSRLADLILPRCRGEYCEHLGSSNRVEFLDTSLHDRLLTSAIVKSMEYDRTQLMRGSYAIRRDSAVLASFAAISSSGAMGHGAGADLEPRVGVANPGCAPVSRTSYVQSRSNYEPLPEVYFNTPRNLGPPIDFPSHLDRVESWLSYQTSVRSPSPSITESTANNDTIQMHAHKYISLEVLQDELLQHLLSNYSKITLTTLVKLGTLRLADMLQVRCLEEEDWTQATVYLFENYIVVLKSKENALVCEMANADISFENNLIRIHSHDKSIWLKSNASSILEKWTVSFSDLSFAFPPEFLTSTLHMDGSSTNTRASVLDDSVNIFFERPSSGNSSSATSIQNPMLNVGFGYSEPDYNTIKDIMSTLNVNDSLLLSGPATEADLKSDYDSDSDCDSDEEKIKGLLV
ncbi:hypothetical protein PSN45_000549 [Yamadazyma tenuis]|uniref:uncharacterized protein n=1 Tax=Candida tenuis TaxID=2315449 RepID=UPI0027AB564E|nr:hypothetical protein PSN45_000549 [Yamadazyma tenuis]